MRGPRIGFSVAIVAAAILAAVGCRKESSCRPGTVFLDVRFGSHANADHIDVDVLVEGGSLKHNSLSVKPGGSGGIEVEFPNGYPTGKVVQIDLTLSSQAGATLAVRHLTLNLQAECMAVTVDFASEDGGVLDTGSAGGGVGRGGAVGSGGAVGGGGATGSGGASGGAAGTGGTCASTGPENCFNGIDDDCDGLVDCADPDCGPTVAQCVGFDPAAGKIGTVTGVTTCPSGYGTPTAIMSGLTAGGCTGCSCGAPPVSCSTTISIFTSNQCTDPTKPAQSVGAFKTGDDLNCTRHPTWSVSDTMPIYGLTTTAFTASAGACAASGTPTLGKPTWGSVGQFCATSTVGGGCGTGKVCVPATASATVCQVFDGAHACPAGTQTSSWSTGYTDTETCGACTCGLPTGVSCASNLISVGTDYGCDGQTVGPSQRLCAGLGSWILPAIKFVGTSAGSCQSQSAVGGSLTATGPKTICCF